MPKRALLVAGALVLVTSPGFAATPIGDVIRSPDTYANTTVTVEGRVTSQSVAYLADTAYTLQGTDDYRITVFGHGPAPAPGTLLSVTGKVGRKPPDEEFDFPPLILESTRAPQ